MKIIITLLLATLFVLLPTSSVLMAQSAPTVKTFDDFMQAVDAIKKAPTTADAQMLVDRLWADLTTQQRIPFTDGEHVVFIFRGAAKSVIWTGDFSFINAGNVFAGEQIADTNLWISSTTFPSTSRLDYLIKLDYLKDVVDPANPLQRLSPFGKMMSELRMPDYVLPDAVIRKADVARGAFSENILIQSTNLKYKVAYRVYTPVGYEKLSKLPTIYVLDGYEMAHEEIGGMLIVLDNLIASHQVKPVIAVFVDTHDPDNFAHNRRVLEYEQNPGYSKFIADELVPAVDAAYKTQADADSRTLVGVSTGGAAALYISLQNPSLFHKVAPFSPWLYDQPGVLKLYSASNDLPLQFFVVSGNPDWDVSNLKDLFTIFDNKHYPYKYINVPGQGHNFAMWRDMLPQMLTYFYPA